MEQKIKLLVLDGDGTCWHYPNSGFGSSWDALSQALGIKDKTDRLMKKYYSNLNLHQEWADKQVALFKGKSIKSAKQKLYPIPYTLGFEDFAKKTFGKIKRGLLTTGLDIVAEKAAKELQLDFCYCNSLNRVDGHFAGTLEYKVPLWDKHLFFDEICNGFSFNEIAYVGDSKNDVLCMSQAGIKIAFNPKDKQIEMVADYVIDDFKELFEILRIK